MSEHDEAFVLQAKAYLGSDGAAALAGWIDTLDETLRNVLLADPDVLAGYEQGSGGGAEQHELAATIDAAITDVQQQLHHLAGVVNQLRREGVSAVPDPVWALGNAHDALLAALYRVQELASGADEALARAVVSTLEAAGSFGSHLAGCGETVDEDGVSALASVLETVGQWCALLPR